MTHISIGLLGFAVTCYAFITVSDLMKLIITFYSICRLMSMSEE